MKKILPSGLIAVLILFAALFGVSAFASTANAARPGMTIYDTAMAVNSSGMYAGSFDMLLAALEKSGLDSAVDGNRQFTVFAPTDGAFAAAGLNTPADLDTLTDQELTNILLYHVLPGNRNSSAVVNSTRVNTLLKQFVSVNGTTLNSNVNIIVPDIFASNGVIHVIDGVLMPE